MKIPSHSRVDRWEQLVRQARADTAPSVDLSSTLRAVRQAAGAPRAGWLADFDGLFAMRPVVRICLAGTAAFALATAWEAWNLWQALPWIQLLSITTAGTI